MYGGDSMGNLGSCPKCNSDLEEVMVSDGAYSEPKGDHLRCKNCGHETHLLASVF